MVTLKKLNLFLIKHFEMCWLLFRISIMHQSYTLTISKVLSKAINISNHTENSACQTLQLSSNIHIIFTVYHSEAECGFKGYCFKVAFSRRRLGGVPVVATSCFTGNDFFVFSNCTLPLDSPTDFPIFRPPISVLNNLFVVAVFTLVAPFRRCCCGFDLCALLIVVKK